MHTSEEPDNKEQCKHAAKDVEEGGADAVGVEDEEGEDGGHDAVKQVVYVVAGEIEVEGFVVVEGIAEEAEDAVAGIID